MNLLFRLVIQILFLGSMGISTIVVADDPSKSVAYQQAVADRVREIADRVLPSIVNIETIGVLQSDGEVRQDAPTTGVFVDEQGHILASSWVTRSQAASIIVTVATGQRFPATVVGKDEHRELVLLKVDMKGTPVQPLVLTSDYVSPSIGSTMLAIARYGESNVPIVSTGVLSAIDRLDGTAIQSDVRISPTFYGGPLMDLDGNVAGILIPAVGENGADDPTGWYDSGIAFAVPTEVIVAKMDRLKNGETIQAGLLGMVVGGSDPYAPGTTISTVRKRSPADKSGLQSGDEILRVGPRPVRRRQEIKLALGRYDAGDEVDLEIKRDDKEQTITATLVETIEPLKPQSLGVTLDDLRVTSILKSSPADKQLQIGDEIKSLDGTKVDSQDSLRQRLWAADPATPVILKVDRVDSKAAASDKNQEDSARSIDITITPKSYAGELFDWSIGSLPYSTPEAWETTQLRLPDVANAAWLYHPNMEAAREKGNASSDDSSTQSNLPTSLIVLLLPPSKRKPEEVLNDWKDEARFQNVAVCLVASEDERKWQLSEIDALSKLTTAAIKQSGASPDAVAIASLGVLDQVSSDSKGNPADSMALAVSLSTDNLVHGVAIPKSTKPPAIRLRRDAPMRLLRVLMTVGDDAELPPWTQTISRIGCPIQTTKVLEQEDLLNWCRSLLVL